MSFAKYPEECPFCLKKFKITSCVLPYALAKTFTLPTNPTDRALELTELHCYFRDDYYQMAVVQVRWYLSKSDKSSDPAPSLTKDWLSDLNPEPQMVTPSEIATYETRSTAAEDTPQSAARVTAFTTETATASRADPPLTSERKEKDTPEPETTDTPSVKSPLTALNLKQHESRLHKEQTQNALSDSEVLHLVEDIAIAATCAQNLRKVKRDKTHLTAILDPLIKEMDIMASTSKSYVPFTDTDLNHQVSLVRELLARHSASSMQNWLDSKLPVVHQHSNGCILNYKPFNPLLSDASLDRRLDNALLQFSRNAIELLSRSPKHKKHALTALKALLEDRKMNTTYEWLINSPLDKLILSDPVLLKTEKDKRAPAPKRTDKRSGLLIDTIPPIPQKTQHLMETHLVDVIKLELAHKNGPAERLPNEIKAPEALTLFTTEVVRYNPRWEQPNFAASLTMVNQVTDNLELGYTTMERLHLMYALTNILKHLRDTQKPKQ